MEKKTMSYAFKTSLPVMAGYIVLGIGFAVLATSKGIAWYYVLLMSIFIYAGSMQYVAIDLIGISANMLTFVLMTLVVNARHLFYGLSMLMKYKDTGIAKPYLIFSLTDETFSLVCNSSLPSSVNEKKYYVYVSLMNQMYWIIGSLIGTFLGNVVTFNSAGIEFSMTALFTVTVIEQWEHSKIHLPALTGFIVSILCLYIFKELLIF